MAAVGMIVSVGWIGCQLARLVGRIGCRLAGSVNKIGRRLAGWDLYAVSRGILYSAHELRGARGATKVYELLAA